MGIGIVTYNLFEEILRAGHLKNCKSVIEMGSQEIQYIEFAKNIINKKINYKDIVSAKDFFLAIGFEKYNSIDADGKYNALTFDLNFNIEKHYEFNNKYDLVTNFGTSEHVFNQKTFFENVHNLTNLNGYMLHMVPFEGQFNHGFFNYQPRLFYDLAFFNDYEIVGFWYFSQRKSKNFKTYSGGNYYPLKYNDELLGFLEELAKKKKLPCTPLNNCSELVIMYKKTNDNNFKDPFQSDLMKEIQLKKYTEKTLNSNSKSKINNNVNHGKQIYEQLGGGYWKIKIKKLFFDKKYREKVIKIIFKEKKHKPIK